MGENLKRKYSMVAVALVVVIGGSLIVSIASHKQQFHLFGSQAAIPSITIWVDAPRLPGAQLYAKVMKGKVNVKVELHAQPDLLAKVQLFNRIKKGWPDVVFGAPNDVAVLKSPLINDAMAVDKLLPAATWKAFGQSNSWCKGSDGKTYCIKNDLAQSVLWYNTKLFKQFSYKVPTKMSQLFAIGADLAKNHPGYSLGALGDMATYATYFWPSQCPLDAEKSSTRVVINSHDRHCTRVTAAIQPLLNAGVYDPRSPFDAGFIKDVAQAGKLVATIGPSWFGEFVLRPASSYKVPAGELTAAPMPLWDGEKVNYSGEWGGGIYTISPHSKFPKQAAAFAMFMVGDKRNVVDVKNSDGSHGAPTFPAYGPGNKLWAAKVNADKYYASSPYPAMLAQANKIFQGEKPVRYDSTGAWGSAFSPELAKSKNLQAALDAYTAYVSHLAQQVGYTVSKS
jgi:ABC-type glycerol-3-phosphate transport system substrate-binding protein